ncbi:hypothetical protein [Psychrobacillus sp. NPDC093200]|uniref:hypothetical protein n=1 Tax=Psychrobacillus sp. NPDC093200 TaxID=3390656 RepID=UPI003CFDB8AE
MRTINDLREICKRFKNGEFDLQELQGRLNTVVMPEPDLPQLSKLLSSLENDIEEIFLHH